MLQADRSASRPPEFHLAIVGGCMSHQPGIPFNSLYHRQVSRAVRDTTGIQVRPHIARGFGLDYAERLDALRAAHEINGVLLHLRVLIMKRARLFVNGVDGKDPYQLHPALFSRSHSGRAIDALRAAEVAQRRDGLIGEAAAERHAGPKRARRSARFRLRSLNWAVGAAVGLDRWAVEDEMLRLRGFARACQERDLPLFVLGPTPLVNRYWQSRSVRLLNGAIRRWAAETGSPCALIEAVRDADGRPIVKPDGVHLTLEGHRFVAETLRSQGVPAWVEASTSDSADVTVKAHRA